MNGGVQVFVSYAHEDMAWMQALTGVLKFRDAEVRPWVDKEIEAGLDWDQRIKQALEEMDIFVALMSVHFAPPITFRRWNCRSRSGATGIGRSRSCRCMSMTPEAMSAIG